LDDLVTGEKVYGQTSAKRHKKCNLQRMKLAKAVFIFCVLLLPDIAAAFGDKPHTLKGVVITPDGTMVPEFTVTIRPVLDKPELIRRKHFKNGEFTLEGLTHAKYRIMITAPLLVGVKLDVDFGKHPAAIEHRIAILHHPRSGPNLTTEEPGYAISSKAMEQKIPDAAREAYQRGMYLHREGHLEEALVEYGRALRHYPQYIQVLGDLGTIYLLYNRPDSALAYLRRALEVDGANSAIRLNVAVALMTRGDYAEAGNQLEAVRRAEPGNSLRMYYTARLQYLQRKYGQAEQTLRQALEENPALLDGWLLLVDIATEQKDYATAREGLLHLRDAMNNRLFSRFVDEQLSTLGS
jgi:Tfp pilus assembly protein PilF